MRQTISELYSAGVIAEMNSLLWITPRMHEGVFDPGWSCRDHAAVLGALIRLDGFSVRIHTGVSYWVAATGGQPVLISVDHSWPSTEAAPVLDTSTRASTLEDQITARFGLKVNLSPPGGFAYRVVIPAWAGTGPPDVIQHWLGELEGRRDWVGIFYESRKAEFLNASHLSARTINSPLTDTIKRHGDLIYAKLVVHLQGVRNGSRAPVASKEPKKAWRMIAAIPDADAHALRAEINSAT